MPLNLPSRAEIANLIAQMDILIEKADDAQWRELRRLLVSAGYVKSSVTLDAIRKLAAKFDDLLAEDVQRIRERLGDCTDMDQVMSALIPKTVALDDPLITGMHRTLRGELLHVVPMLAQAYSARIDNKLVVDSITQRTMSFVDSWSRNLSVLMRLNTDATIKQLITTALQNGESVQKLALRIQNSGTRDPYWRARRVAITELLRAHSYAAQEAMTQNPAVEGKRWRHTGSRFNKPRPNHVAMDGVTVPKNDPFVLSGADGGIYSPMVPRDTSLPAKESVNCHCIVQPVVNERMLGLPLEERQRLRDEAVSNDNRKWAAQLDAEKHALADMLRAEAVDRDALTRALERTYDDGGDVWRMLHP